MGLASVRTSQVSKAALDWYGNFLGHIEARDLPAMLAFLDDECVVQVNDQLPIYGKPAIARSMELYYEMFSRVEHELLNVYGSDAQFSVELLCHYVCAEAGVRVTIPAAVMYDRDAAGQFISIRLYISAGGMFKAFTEPAA